MNIIEAVALKYTVVGTGRYRTTVEHNSLVMDTERNLFYWNSKAVSGTVAYFLTTFIGMSRRAAELIAEPPQEADPPRTQSLSKEIALFYWEYGKLFRKFWYKRGYTDKTIDHYKLGYFAGYYTFPFLCNKNLTAISMRNKWKHFRESPGSSLSLFGYDQLDPRIKQVLFVESVVDVPLLHQYGFNAVSHNYGSMAWDHSWNILLGKWDLYIVPDNDRAGVGSISRVPISCKVVQWPTQTPTGFDIEKLCRNNPAKFQKNVEWLLRTSVPIEFLG